MELNIPNPASVEFDIRGTRWTLLEATHVYLSVEQVVLCNRIARRTLTCLIYCRSFDIGYWHWALLTKPTLHIREAPSEPATLRVRYGQNELTTYGWIAGRAIDAGWGCLIFKDLPNYDKDWLCLR
jgi:hypothetical protein